MKKFIIPAFVLGVIIPSLAFGAGDIDIWKTPPGYWGPLLSCGINDPNPAHNVKPQCENFCDLIHTAQHVIYFGLSILLFALAPAFIAYGGFMILISGGSTERLEQGKKTLRAAVIGLLIGLGAFLIVNSFIVLLGITLGVNIGWSSIDCNVQEFRTFPLPSAGAEGASGSLNFNVV